MKLCDTCIYRNENEYHKPCIVYRDDCEYYEKERDEMKECHRCGFNDEDYGCTCPHSDKWYACPIESKKPENVKALKEYAECIDAFKEYVLGRK